MNQSMIGELTMEKKESIIRDLSATARNTSKSSANSDRTFFKTHHPSAADMAWEVLKASANRLSSDGCFDDEEPDSDDECFVD